MITSAEQLVTALDHVEISRVVTEHAWRVDHGRADTVHELYVDEGELIVPPTPLRGRPAIYEWGQRLMADSRWRTIRQVCSNMRFIADGLYSAEGTTVTTVFMVAERSATTTIPWMVGEYHDRFVRTHDGWKLVSRRWVELFTRGDALT